MRDGRTIEGSLNDEIAGVPLRSNYARINPEDVGDRAVKQILGVSVKLDGGSNLSSPCRVRDTAIEQTWPKYPFRTCLAFGCR